MKLSRFLILVLAFAAYPHSLHAADASYAQGVKAWNQLKASQAAACSSAMDAQQILRGRRTEVSVLVLHGFAQSPAHMRNVIEFFRGYNVNVIAPRMPGHYGKDLRALDRARFSEWLQASEKAFQAAKLLGRRVVIVGYSMGGLLGSGLALNHPSDTAALVLLSPAWRVDASVSIGAAVGNILGINGNEYLKSAAAACDVNTPYLSSKAGRQVPVLGTKIDPAYPRLAGSAFRLIQAPTFMALVDQDPVVDSPLVKRIFQPTEGSGYRTLLMVSGKSHGLFTGSNLALLHWNQATSNTPYSGSTLLEQMEQFLAQQAELRR